MKLLKIALNLFDGAEGAAEQAAEPAAEAGKTGAKVVYGKQPEQTKAPDAGEQEKARRARFDEIVRGEYKDLYDEQVQSIVKARIGDSKALKGRLEAVEPVMELLGQRYGLDSGDAKALAKAIEQDDAYWEQAAEDAGMSVSQFRTMQKLERENTRMQRERNAMIEEQRTRETIGKWEQQAEQARALYPGLDLNKEAANPQFLRMLQSGVDVRAAYEVVHMEEIKNGARQEAAKTAARNVTQNIRAKGLRPPENGAAGQSGVILKNDVHKLTRDDRAEIIRRVARGERITF